MKNWNQNSYPAQFNLKNLLRPIYFETFDSKNKTKNKEVQKTQKHELKATNKQRPTSSRLLRHDDKFFSHSH